MNRNICIVTGSRSEYGLLFWLIKQVHEDADLNLQIIATCMHLSSEFGLTYRRIEADGFKIDKKIEMLLSSDTPSGISKSMGLAFIGFADAFAELKPDLIVLLGDRFETFCAAGAAYVARIPIAHIHGGEITEGAIDEAFRHAITKMSQLHFTSTEVYRRRVIQLGEYPDSVFNVGAIGIENIRRLSLLSKDELEKDIGFHLGDQYLLVTFHPLTRDHHSSEKQFNNLLDALDQVTSAPNTSLKILFTKANADTGGRIINQLIDRYVSLYSEKAISFSTMGQSKYLSAMKNASAVVGNSSSGIIEAPSFKVPTVNIGDRQKGRIRAESVIDCEATKTSIVNALKNALSFDFSQSLRVMNNPYEKADTVRSILNLVKNSELEKIIRKKFYDLHLERGG